MVHRVIQVAVDKHTRAIILCFETPSKILLRKGCKVHNLRRINKKVGPCDDGAIFWHFGCRFRGECATSCAPLGGTFNATEPTNNKGPNYNYCAMKRLLHFWEQVFFFIAVEEEMGCADKTKRKTEASAKTNISSTISCFRVNTPHWDGWMVGEMTKTTTTIMALVCFFLHVISWFLFASKNCSSREELGGDRDTHKESPQVRDRECGTAREPIASQLTWLSVGRYIFGFVVVGEETRCRWGNEGRSRRRGRNSGGTVTAQSRPIVQK